MSQDLGEKVPRSWLAGREKEVLRGPSSVIRPSSMIATRPGATSANPLVRDGNHGHAFVSDLLHHRQHLGGHLRIERAARRSRINHAPDTGTALTVSLRLASIGLGDSSRRHHPREAFLNGRPQYVLPATAERVPAACGAAVIGGRSGSPARFLRQTARPGQPMLRCRVQSARPVTCGDPGSQLSAVVPPVLSQDRVSHASQHHRGFASPLACLVRDQAGQPQRGHHRVRPPGQAQMQDIERSRGPSSSPASTART